MSGPGLPVTAPPLASGWRTCEGTREFVVICRCGVAGTPESLAWTGDSCGPCHDREEEGLPPLGWPVWWPHLQRGEQVWPLRVGRFLTALSGGYDQFGTSSYSIRCWDTIDGKTPAWESQDAWLAPVVDCGGRFLAAFSDDGDVATVDISTGARLSRAANPAGWPIWLAWVPGTGGGRLLILDALADAVQVHAIDCRENGDLLDPPRALASVRDYGLHLAASPHRPEFLFTNDTRFEVRDALTGKATEALVFGTSDGLFLSLAFLPDRAIIAGHLDRGFSRPSLVRWSPPSGKPQRQGFFSWLLGFDKGGRTPDHVVQTAGAVGEVVLAPADEIASVEGSLLTARCARTLRLRASFEPVNAIMRTPITFTPDGRLLAMTDKGLAVWPWRELMGRKQP